MKFAKLKKTFISSIMLTVIVSAVSVSAEALNSNFESINGRDRVETSIKASRNVKSDMLVVANAYKFSDSLSAYNIVGKYKAKLILVDDNTNLYKEIKDQNISKVYVIGGNDSISKNVLDSIYAGVGKTNVLRVAGRDRYETNKKTIDISGYATVGVADGRNFADALTSTGLLSSKNMGLMLVDGSKPFKTDKKVAYTFGGENSVKYAQGKRIAGKDRYETNLGCIIFSVDGKKLPSRS